MHATRHVQKQYLRQQSAWCWRFSHILLVLLSYNQLADCLHCYDCDNIVQISTCQNISQCTYGQSCYLEIDGERTFSLGCADNQKCGVSAVGGISLIGRTTRQNHCLECCSTDNCNINLCVHQKPSTCMDDVKVDCAYLNTMFNFCADVHHAKTVCPNFCGLCLLVDGNWAEWSVWSACDVSCENGTQTRRRTCTNPTPANGGLNCPGSNTEAKLCTKQLCPVHGGWSEWGNWELCSSTCGHGLQKRHRACSNPIPERFGNHCFGESMDVQLCLSGVCKNDVSWNEWLSWTSCSVTCEVGIQKRYRNCSSTATYSSGIACNGQSMDVQICSAGPCTDGLWTTWSSWGQCSSSCGIGTISRSRTCINNGLFNRLNCDGNSVEFSTCEAAPCLSHVAFEAYHIAEKHEYQGQRMLVVFSSLFFNEGNAYNSTTGMFTAPVEGLFHFSTHICTFDGEMFVEIMMDGSTYATGMSYSYKNEYCASAETIIRVFPGAKVYIAFSSDTQNPGILQWDRLNTFAGFMV